MNVLNLAFWWRLLAALGLEVCCLGALAWVVGRVLRSAISQKTVWQIMVICLLLLPLSEWTGFGRGAARFVFGQKQTAPVASAPSLSLPSAPLSWRKRVLPPIGSRTPQPTVWWPGWVWLAGTVIVLGRTTAGQVLLLTLRLRRERISDRALQDRVGQVANRLGLRRKINLLRMPQAISPMAFGLLQPKIGLPPRFEAEYTVAEQEAVLAHELAHLAANDPKWFLLADCVTALLWWHPLVWWMRRNLHLSAEVAADEATALVPDGPDALAKCLVALGQKMMAPRGWGWIGISGGFQSRLGLRVERLLRLSKAGARPPVTSVPRKLIATLVVLPSVVLLCGAVQSAHGQKQDTWKEEMSASWNSSPGALVFLAALDDKEQRAASSRVQSQPIPLNATPQPTDDKQKESQNVPIAARVQNAKLLYEMGKLKEAEAILVQVTQNDPSYRMARYYLDLIKEADLSKAASSRAQPQPIPLNSAAQPMFIPLTWDEQPMFIPLDTSGNLEYVQTFLAPNGSNFSLQLAPQYPLAPPQPAPLEPPSTLYSKVFKIDPSVIFPKLTNMYAQSLGNGKPNATSNAVKMLKAYFTAAGVSFTAPDKNLSVNNRTGLLYVRATEQDLEIIRDALKSFDPVPPRMTIEAKFTELSPDEIHNVGLDDYLVRSTNNSASFFPASRTIPIGNTGHPSDIALGGVLERAQFLATLSAIEQLRETDVLSTPKATTESGREIDLVSDGTELDILASVEQDGFVLLAHGWARTPSWLQNFGGSRLLDGQTLVFGGPANQMEPARKTPIVFVTLRIIDAKGNAVHPDEDLPW